MTSAPSCSFPGLLVLLPYHIGFHLDDSVVVVALRDTTVDLVERVDVPSGSSLLDDFTTARLVLALNRRRPSAVVVVAYGDRTDVTTLLESLVRAIEEVVPVARVAVVRRGRWREIPAGRWLPLPAAADVPLVAEYVGRGVCPLPDRAALTASLGPGPCAPIEAMAASVARRGRPSADEGLAAWDRLLEPGVAGSESGDEVTALSFLGEIVDRDLVLSRLVPTTGAGDHRRSLRRASLTVDPAEDRITTRAVLVRLCRTAPPSVRAAALSVLAVWAWDSGDGATAAVAADLALEHDPTYVLAALVGRLVQFDVRPPAA